MLWWNGTALPVPDTDLQFIVREEESEHSGILLSGRMSKKVRAVKEDITASWTALSESEMALIRQVKSSTYGTLKILDPLTGNEKTRQCYTGELEFVLNLVFTSPDGGEIKAVYSANLTFMEV